MQTTIPILVGILLVALLTLVCSCHVERDALETASAAVAGAGHSWAEVDASGRWVTLTGMAPSAAAQGSAARAALAPVAVTRVTDNSTLTGGDGGAAASTEEAGAGSAAAGGVSGDDAGAGAAAAGGVSGDDAGAGAAAAVGVSGDDEDSGQNAAAEDGSAEARAAAAAQAAASQASAECQASLESIMADETVRFEFARADLAPAGRALLNRLAEVMQSCSDKAVRVEAHSDNVGSPASNMTLSQARAQSVVDYLVQAGVERSRLTAQGFGEASPRATNNTVAGRAQNRRVEFRIGS